MLNNLKSGIRWYRGRYGIILNVLWWGVAPAAAVALAVGIVTDRPILAIAGLVAVLIASVPYTILATRNEQG